ncbi:hypothetical protein V6Z12_D06G129000 [Gossypium hirsutum]
MARQERTLREYALPTLDVVRASIERQSINTNNFEIKMATIQNFQNKLQFRGNIMQDLNQNLKRFLQLCDTFKYNGVTDDVIFEESFQSFHKSLISLSFTSGDTNTVISFLYILRAELDGAFSRAFINNTYERAYQLIEDMDELLYTALCAFLL